MPLSHGREQQQRTVPQLACPLWLASYTGQGRLYALLWKRTCLWIPLRDGMQRRAVVDVRQWPGVLRRLAVALAVADASRPARGTRSGNPASIALNVHLENRR